MPASAALKTSELVLVLTTPLVETSPVAAAFSPSHVPAAVLVPATGIFLPDLYQSLVWHQKQRQKEEQPPNRLHLPLLLFPDYVKDPLLLLLDHFHQNQVGK